MNWNSGRVTSTRLQRILKVIKWFSQQLPQLQRIAKGSPRNYLELIVRKQKKNVQKIPADSNNWTKFKPFQFCFIIFIWSDHMCFISNYPSFYTFHFRPSHFRGQRSSKVTQVVNPNKQKRKKKKERKKKEIKAKIKITLIFCFFSSRIEFHTLLPKPRWLFMKRVLFQLLLLLLLLLLRWIVNQVPGVPWPTRDRSILLLLAALFTL